MTPETDPRPEPGDLDFFARFTLSDDILDAAFGPTGGTPPPRVVHRQSREVPAGQTGTTTPRP
jgi:hypothetical protein